MDLLERCLIVKIAVDEALAEQDREEKWHAFVKQTEPIEDKFKPVLRTAFTKQEKSILVKLRRTPVPEIESGEKSVIYRDIDTDEVLFKASEEAEAASQAYVDAIYTAEEWQAVFTAAFTPFVTEAYREAGQAAFVEIGFEAAFNVTNPRARKFLEDRIFDNVKGVNDTTREKLRRALVQGLDAGEGIPQISQRVADVFEINKGSRTNAIARTEIVGASNNGTYHGYVESEIVETHTWIDSRDNRVRESPHNHRLDGEEVKLGERFSNGLLHPHDPGGAAGNVINCRCTLAASELKEAT